MRVTLVRLVVIALLLASSAAQARSGASLAGTWSGTLMGEPLRLVLQGDGSGSLDGDPIAWSNTADVLTIVSEGEAIVYAYRLEGGCLTVAGGDLLVPLTLTRAGGTKAVTAPAARPAAKAPALAPAKPQAAKAAGGIAAFLAGRYWAYSSSADGGYSTERKAALCADGSFFFGSESGGSGRLTNQYGDVTATYGAVGTTHGDGTWSATGDRSAGTLTLRYHDGRTDQIRYRVSTRPADQSGYGPAVEFNGTLYQRTGDGSCR